jgi:NAD(P)-dependent dehydrogenase (short-subunit alcohol dehydrogenase family)
MSTWLITGCSTGLGRALAEAVIGAGHTAVVTARDVTRVADLTERAPDRVLPVALDVTNADQVASAVQQAQERFGGVDVLVNNAAEQHEQDTITDIGEHQLVRTFATNVFGYFHMTKAVLPHLEEGDAIVNTTSVTAYKGSGQLLDYASTRGAIVAFTRSLAQRLSDRKIRVNGVAPGPIWTPLIPASFDAERVAHHGASAPMGRPGQPNEVAPCHLFLACADSSYMSGQVLHPNGGTVVDS